MNKHRGSDFNDFMIEENLMTPTPRTDEFARAECCDLEHALEFARQLERELAAERALADRLAALLQRDRDGYGGQKVDPDCDCCDCEYLRPIDEALAAWKEARHET